jgi:TRAP-type mannitol/chloroaromatic compound transport system permease large subunit
VADSIAGMQGGQGIVLAAVLLALALSALVLDAFEIIFVVIPIVMPPLLMRVPDAVWVAVIALLMLQASFLLPPLGYAVLLIRGEMKVALSIRKLARALAPYVGMQLLVLGLVLACPSMVHLAEPQEAVKPATADDTSDDGWKLLQQQREEQDERQEDQK